MDTIELLDDVLGHFESAFKLLVNRLYLAFFAIFSFLVLEVFEHRQAAFGLVQVHNEDRDELVQEDVTISEETNKHWFLQWIKHHGTWLN